MCALFNAEQATAAREAGSELLKDLLDRYSCLTCKCTDDCCNTCITAVCTLQTPVSTLCCVLACVLRCSSGQTAKVAATVHVFLTQTAHTMCNTQHYCSPLYAALHCIALHCIVLYCIVCRCVGGGGTYGDRRGAALGVAAVVKGLGIAALKREGIMARLEEVRNITHYTVAILVSWT
jgi:hypothetical protein